MFAALLFLCLAAVLDAFKCSRNQMARGQLIHSLHLQLKKSLEMHKGAADVIFLCDEKLRKSRPALCCERREQMFLFSDRTTIVPHRATPSTTAVGSPWCSVTNRPATCLKQSFVLMVNSSSGEPMGKCTTSHNFCGCVWGCVQASYMWKSA